METATGKNWNTDNEYIGAAHNVDPQDIDRLNPRFSGNMNVDALANTASKSVPITDRRALDGRFLEKLSSLKQVQSCTNMTKQYSNNRKITVQSNLYSLTKRKQPYSSDYAGPESLILKQQSISGNTSPKTNTIVSHDPCTDASLLDRHAEATLGP
eukprot:CAMPEP_0171870268 /NCGR_PEP_ID=MMETSP0992-20121227/32515_1 /TAXON_ID=483369 /ORGANISM="non described non described, Strain CCMP2098" /LENGTH=155 /DNA_ID=CAMNT_0012494325 /DNA_START=797 /DNA_END=1264 /DNA_ORIENTATION=-